MKKAACLVILSISSSASSMHRSQPVISDYEPTVAILGAGLNNWCAKNEIQRKIKADADHKEQEVVDQKEPVFHPLVDRWVKSMCVALTESGAYQKDPEFHTQLLLRKALEMQMLIEWAEQSSSQKNL